MATIFDQYDKDADLNYAPLSKKEKKKSEWGPRILCVIIGFVIALSSCLGGAFILLKQPVKTVFPVLSPVFGLDYETQIKNNYLSQKYEGYTLQQLPGLLDKALSEQTLGALADVVPYIGNVIRPTVANLNEVGGLSLDVEAILSTKYDELPEYLKTEVLTTPLGEILMALQKTDHLVPSVMDLCYGFEGYDYVFTENGIEMINGAKALTLQNFLENSMILNYRVSITSVLDPSSNTMYLPMCYGEENTTFTVERDEFGQIVKNENGKVNVEMSQLYFLKTESGFSDYQGKKVNGAVVQETEEYTVFTAEPAYEGDSATTYYLRADESGEKYYAYFSTDVSEPAKFRPLTLSDLSGPSASIIDNIYLKDALNVYYSNNSTKPDPHQILFSLAYGVKGEDYEVVTVDGKKGVQMIGDAKPRTLGDLRSNSTKIIDSIVLCDIIPSDTDEAILNYVLYGRENLHYTLEADGSVTMLQRQVLLVDDGTKITVYNEYGELMDQASAASIEEKIFADESDTAHRLNYSLTENGANYYLEIDPFGKKQTTKDGKEAIVCFAYDQTFAPVLFKKSTIGDLTGNLIGSLLDRVTVNDAFGMKQIGGHRFLRYLGNSTIKEIPADIEKLTIGQIFAADIFLADDENAATTYHGYYLNGGDEFEDSNGETVYSIDFYLKVLKEGTTDEYDYYRFDPLTAFDSEEHELEIEARYGIELNVELNKQWKYLLNDRTRENKSAKQYRFDYLISDGMDNLTENLATNVHYATLGDLYNDKLLQLENGKEDLLEKPVQTSISFGGSTHDLGLSFADELPTEPKVKHLTMEQMIEYNMAILDFVNNYTP